MKVLKNISIVAIQNYGSSGTLFLQSLFDNHRKVLMTPALYSHSFYFFWEKRTSKNIDDLIDEFIVYHSYWFSKKDAVKAHGLHQMGTKMDQQIHIEATLFREFLKQLVGNQYPSRKNFFIAVYLAYAKALGRKNIKPQVIFFPIHSLPKKHAAYLIKDFPNTKFIHMVRNPLDCINSLIKHILFNQLPVNVFECATSQMLCDYMRLWGKESEREVFGFKPHFQNRKNFSKAIRLEDLHQKNKETLGKICKWLEIPWDNHLLKSTFDGRKWWNRPESPRISGTGIQVIDRKVSYLNRLDQFRLLCLTHPKYKHWDYKISNMYGTNILRLLVFFLLVLPFKTEFSLLKYRLIFFAQKQYKTFQYQALNFIKSIDINLGAKTLIFYNKHFGVIKVLLFILLLIFAPIFILACLVLIIRDYFAIRYWVYKSWFDIFNKRQAIVGLLPID